MLSVTKPDADDNALKKGSRPSRFRRESFLWLLGFLTALTLANRNAVVRNEVTIYFSDFFAHLKCSLSMLDSIRQFQFPPRVCVGLFQDIGEPTHQFYSPASHFLIAVFSLLVGGHVFYGLLGAVLFTLTLAFVSTFKLCRYLTQSNLLGYVGAFVFISAPYLSTNRVQRGAYPEYFAMSLLPLVIYCQLRLWAKCTPKRIIAASLYWAALLHLHLITSSYAILFMAVFLVLQWLWMAVARSKGNSGAPRKLLTRTVVGAGAGLLALFVSAWYIYPVAFYKDISIRQSFRPAHEDAGNTTTVTLLSLIDSVADQVTAEASFRFQIGVVLFAGFAGFIMLRKRQTSSVFIWPLWLTAVAIFFLIISPVNIFIGPLRSIDIAQFTFRYLAQLSILLVILSVLTLRSLFDLTIRRGFGKAWLYGLSLTIIVAALAFGAPYLSMKPGLTESNKFTPAGLAKEADVWLGNGAYIRVLPVNEKPYTCQDNAAEMLIVPAVEGSTSFDKLFVVDLNDANTLPQWKGELAFDVLYYPGLQSIETYLDDRPFDADITTYWLGCRHDIGVCVAASLVPEGSIRHLHLLMLRSLPAKGKLTIHAKFTGSRVGNYCSIIGLLAVLGLAIASGRERKKTTAENPGR